MQITDMRSDKQVLGEFAVYPGHPVTIALLIISRYPSFAEAVKTTPHGFPEAVGDNAIPGAGGDVYMALDLLAHIKVKGIAPEEAIAFFEKRWLEGSASGFKDRVKAGQEQADRFKATFLEKLVQWPVDSEPTG